MSTKYTNIGQSDGVIVGTTVVDTEKQYSNTGSAVYGPGKNVTPADLGFSGDVTDLWIRFDYYVYTYSPTMVVGFFFDGNSGSDYVGLNADRLYYGVKGNDYTGYSSSVYGKTINKVVLHATTTSLTLVVNGDTIINKTGITNGQKITGLKFKIDSGNQTTVGNNNMFSNIIVADYDCSNETLVSASTTINATVAADVLRKTIVDVDLSADISRVIQDNTSISTTITADISRKTTVDINLSGSTDRKIVYDAISEIDTRRRTSAYSVAINDLMRKTTVNVTIEADTSRGRTLTTNFAADTRISIPSVVTDKSSGLQSISISTGQSQLSDNVKIVTANLVDINGAVTGHFLDYELNMRAEETSQTGILQEITCMTDKDEILYKKIVYTGDADARIYHGKEIYNESVANNSDIVSYMKLSKHMSKIAGVLGCNLELHSDDFISTCSLNDSGATYQSIISELCRWTSKIPNMFINAFIRGNTLYIIQRGHEPNEINIDNLKITIPTIDKKLIRTEWNNAQSTSGGDGTGVKPPIIIDNGKSKKTEESTSEDRQEPREETETDTRYADDGGYTVTTTTRRYEAVSELHGAVMIVRETERCVAHPASTDESNTTTVTLTETYHTYDSYGWHTVETVTTVDGVLTDTHTNKSLGSTEGVTPYRARAAGEFSIGGDDGASKYNSLVDSDFPVHGDYLKTCRDDLKWLNRKVQETVTLSIYDYTHIFNFCDRIIYNGNAYSIQSASFEKNATVVNRQDLVLIRFY